MKPAKLWLGPEWTGFNSGGRVVSKNGQPWQIPEELQDARDLVAVGDTLGYENTGQTWQVTFVDQWTVRSREVMASDITPFLRAHQNRWGWYYEVEQDTGASCLIASSPYFTVCLSVSFLDFWIYAKFTGIRWWTPRTRWAAGRMNSIGRQEPLHKW